MYLKEVASLTSGHVMPVNWLPVAEKLQHFFQILLCYLVPYVYATKLCTFGKALY